MEPSVPVQTRRSTTLTLRTGQRVLEASVEQAGRTACLNPDPSTELSRRMSPTDSNPGRPQLWLRLGDWITRKRGTVQAGFFILTLVSCLGLPWLLRIDTDALAMLPQSLASVRDLRSFAGPSASDGLLTIGLLAPEGLQMDPRAMESFEAELRRQPWVLRTFRKAPDGVAESLLLAREFAPVLLLQEPPEQVESLLARLGPTAFAKRLDRLLLNLSSGAPGAEVELFADPTGVLRPLLSQLQRATGGGLGAGRALGSEDGRLLLVLVETVLTENAGAPELLMAQVHDFTRSWIQAQPPEIAARTEILVTGRPAYVAEIGGALWRDISTTLAGAGIAVLALFWIGFRRLRTVAAVGAVLLGSCLVTLALGALLLGPINLITAGFCAILVGLGVDFALLISDRHQRALEGGSTASEAVAVALAQAGPGIAYAALTTAIAFLSLVISRAGALTQLGMLIALGLVVTALKILVFVFPLAGVNRRDPESARHRTTLFDRLGLAVLGSPRLWLGVGLLAVFLPCAAMLATERWPVLQGDLRSMEPEGIAAGRSLARIQELTASTPEPLILVRRHDDAAAARTDWSRLREHLQTLKAEGRIQSFTTPEAVLFDPQRAQSAHALLSVVDWESRERELKAIWEERGLKKEEFLVVSDVLERLSRIAQAGPPTGWSDVLPAESGWWFLLDRLLPPESGVSCGFVVPRDAVTTADARRGIERELGLAEDQPTPVTGFKVLQADLLEWIRTEMLGVVLAVAVTLALMLMVTYRSPGLAVMHLLCLGLALTATFATLSLLQIPLNLVNAMGLPLILGVGVDYGIQFLVAIRGGRAADAVTIFRPVALSALTTCIGFASLLLAENPALRGLGIVCAIGVLYSLILTCLVLLPLKYLLECRSQTSLR